MEKYEPSAQQQRADEILSISHHDPLSDYLPEQHHYSDYAYAYYEPGAPMRHQNIPSVFYEKAGPSQPPPPNSIRALLSTARRNNLARSSGKYSAPPRTQQSARPSQENLYEEIHDAERRKNLHASDSVMSLNQSLVEEEVLRVQNRHHRVLGELNLSVEEMLMPTPAITFIHTSPMTDPHTNAGDFFGNDEVADGNGAGSYNNNLELDSGFRWVYMIYTRMSR